MADQYNPSDSKSPKPDGPRKEFNEQEYWAQRVAEASPSAKEQLTMLESLAEDRLKKEEKDQKRYHNFRETKAQNELLKNYIKNQALRPESVRKNPEQDLKLIEEQARDIVARKEAYYTQRIKDELTENTRQVLNRDRQMQRDAPDLQREFRQQDQEHER